jgi:hypothetical protein
MPTQTADLYLLEDLEGETRTAEFPAVPAWPAVAQLERKGERL